MKYLDNISYDDIDKGIEYLKNNKLNFFLPKGSKPFFMYIGMVN